MVAMSQAPSCGISPTPCVKAGKPKGAWGPWGTRWGVGDRSFPGDMGGVLPPSHPLQLPQDKCQRGEQKARDRRASSAPPPPAPARRAVSSAWVLSGSVPPPGTALSSRTQLGAPPQGPSGQCAPEHGAESAPPPLGASRLLCAGPRGMAVPCCCWLFGAELQIECRPRRQAGNVQRVFVHPPLLFLVEWTDRRPEGWRPRRGSGQDSGHPSLFVLLPFSAATLLGDLLSLDANEGRTPWGPASQTPCPHPQRLHGFPGGWSRLVTGAGRSVRAADGRPCLLSSRARHLPMRHCQEGGGLGRLPTLPAHPVLLSPLPTRSDHKVTVLMKPARAALALL